MSDRLSRRDQEELLNYLRFTVMLQEDAQEKMFDCFLDRIKNKKGSKWNNTKEDGAWLLKYYRPKYKGQIRKVEEGDATKWDITLLSFYLTNPELGLCILPDEKAAICGIRDLRNNCLAHVEKSRLDTSTLNKYVSQLKKHYLKFEWPTSKIDTIQNEDFSRDIGTTFFHCCEQWLNISLEELELKDEELFKSLQKNQEEIMQQLRSDIAECKQHYKTTIDNKLDEKDRKDAVRHDEVMGAIQGVSDVAKLSGMKTQNEVINKIQEANIQLQQELKKIMKSSTTPDTKSVDESMRRPQQELQEMEIRVRELDGRVEESDRRAEQMQLELKEARQQLRMSEQSLQERTQEVQLVRQQLRECEKHLAASSSHWIVRRDEIEMTGPELGRGSWAIVSVATFRGVQVAAKTIHHQIISPHNIQLFRREMNMASKLRHPNLVQFIGATIEGSMVILTELMPTSLRAQFHVDLYLQPRFVRSISLDVARALNYLHQMQPNPIIHRDISSANVLLELLSGGQWRAKLSDYGTVNLAGHLGTQNPGSVVYAAPEANDPLLQSPKMDIYSFGALMLEMLTGQLPTREDRPALLLRVHHDQLLALIQRCLNNRRQDRPSAAGIIEELS